MKKLTCIYAALFIFISSTAFAGATITQINSLIERHGKKNVANYIRENSEDNTITIQMDNQLIVKAGKVSPDYITATSIKNDFDRLNLSFDKASAEIVDKEADSDVKAYSIISSPDDDRKIPVEIRALCEQDCAADKYEYRVSCYKACLKAHGW